MAKVPFKLQQAVPVEYKGVNLECGYRIDILVDDKIILELKSVESLQKVHEAQLITYMKLAGVKTGLLINFNERMLKDGLKRFVL